MSNPRRIVISPYDPVWPSDYAAIEARLRSGLGDLALRIDHIGSTAVPGLAAKDIIDIQVTVAELDDPRIVPAFERLGAAPTTITSDHVPPGSTGDDRAWEKRYFRPPPSWRPTHLHVREAGRANWRYALLFRDYLRHEPAAAAAYARLKAALAQLVPDDPAAYYDVKDPACDLIMDAAERWASSCSWTP